MILLYLLLGILAYWAIGLVIAVILVKCFHEEPDEFLLTMCLWLWPLLIFMGIIVGMIWVTGRVVKLITGKPFHFFD